MTVIEPQEECFPYSDTHELKKLKKLEGRWSVFYSGAEIRQLDKFENQIIEAAIIYGKSLGKAEALDSFVNRLTGEN
jgi:hypothetical protein